MFVANAAGIFDDYSPLPQRISLADDEGEPSAFERSAKTDRGLLPAPKPDNTIRKAPGYAGYSDGSIVVEVRDFSLNVMVLMRQFPTGELRPLEEDDRQSER